MRTKKAVVVGTVVVVVVAALAVSVLSSEPRDEASLATLRAVSGRVSIDAGGGPRPVRGVVPVRAGMEISTGPGALATIEYFDGSLTRIGPATTYDVLELEDLDDAAVIVGRVGIGETFHDVKAVTGSRSRFEVQESNAVAVVRGTKFAARCLPPLPCGIAVVEGVVVVTPSSGEAVEVGAGRRVTIDADGRLGEVTDVSPDDPWLNRNRALGEAGA